MLGRCDNRYTTETVGNLTIEQRPYFLVYDLLQTESYTLFFSSMDVSSRDRLVVRTLRCGRSNPGSNPGHGNLHERLRSDLPDLVFLQECIESSDSLNHTFNRLGYRGFSSICEERGHGVAVLYRETLHTRYTPPGTWSSTPGKSGRYFFH